MKRVMLSGIRGLLSILMLPLAALQAQSQPAAPSSLTATDQSSQIRLDWADNSEPDLAVYHVYRSESSGGPYMALDGDGTQPLQSLASPTSTGEKPQSKVWSHGNYWWSVFSDGTGTWLWRLDLDTWTKVLQLNAGTTARADCKPDGDVTHILLYNGVGSQLASVEFVPGNPATYQFWSSRPGLVDITLSSGVETATIDVDSTGRMWLASDAVNEIEVRYSDAPYGVWNGPVILATGISSDDIGVVTALKDGTVGVLWSNQGARRFGFRVHLDGDDPTLWSADEVPASQSADDQVGQGMADDHLNVAVGPDNTLYAAVKTSYDTVGYPKIALLVRRPSGQWDPLYDVDQSGTRPIVVLDESFGVVKVIYTASEGLNNIVSRQSPADEINLGPTEVVIAGGWNNVTSTRQNLSGPGVILASSGSQVTGAFIDVRPPSPTASEFVDASALIGRTYYYVVTAENISGLESDASNEASATISEPSPSLLANGLAVPIGNVAGTLDATFTADGVVQAISETSVGPKGRSSLVAEYVMGTVADPESVTELVIQFQGAWSGLDGADPLVVSVWNDAAVAWEFIDWTVGPTPALFEVNLSAAPSDYINPSGQVRILFADTGAFDREKKDSLEVDLLVGLIMAGPNLPPAPPINLQASPGDTIVRLTWDPSPDNDVVGYDVERDGVLVASLGDERAYTDTGLANGVSYAYAVIAVDSASQFSNPSTPASATPDNVYLPEAPEDLTATAGTGKVTLTWTGNLESRVVDYQVYRSTTSPVVIGPATLLAVVPHTGSGAPLSYDDFDVNVSEDTTFYYVITATDLDDDVSAPSLEVAATVTLVSPEELFIITADYASKPKKLTIVATSTLGGAVVLSLFGGPDETSIDFGNPLLEALSYDANTDQHTARLRTASPPGWVAVTSTGGGTPALAPVTLK